MSRRAAGLIALYVAGSALSAFAAINATDLDAFFFPSAREVLAGRPLHVYSVRHDTLYPNANGPLSLIPLTTAAAAAARLGWIDDPRLRRVVVMAVFSLFALLLAREAVAFIDRARGHRAGGRNRVLLYAVFALPPLLWHSVLLYGHVEQPLCLWLVLYSVRALARRRLARAGAAAGLAALDRTVAVLYLATLALMLLRNRQGRGALLYVATAAATVGLGLAPFLLGDGANTIFSLVSFRGALPVGGGSIWDLSVGTGFEGWAQHLDGIAAVSVALLLAGLVLWRRGGLTADDRGTYGLLALVALCFPLMVKTVWPYYFLDAYVLAAVWALSRRGRWHPRQVMGGLLLPAVISGCGFLAEIGVDAATGPALRRSESVAMFVVLAATIAGLARALIRGDYGTAVGSAEGAGAAGAAPEGAVPGAVGTGTPEGGGDTGADVGPSGGVGQLARATLKGVGDGLAVGVVPAGGVTYGV